MVNDKTGIFIHKNINITGEFKMIAQLNDLRIA